MRARKLHSVSSLTVFSCEVQSAALLRGASEQKFVQLLPSLSLS